MPPSSVYLHLEAHATRRRRNKLWMSSSGIRRRIRVKSITFRTRPYLSCVPRVPSWYIRTCVTANKKPEKVLRDTGNNVKWEREEQGREFDKCPFFFGVIENLAATFNCGTGKRKEKVAEEEPYRAETKAWNYGWYREKDWYAKFLLTPRAAIYLSGVCFQKRSTQAIVHRAFSFLSTRKSPLYGDPHFEFSLFSPQPLHPNTNTLEFPLSLAFP